MTTPTDREAARAGVRPATRADAAAVARFIDMAGHGLPYHLWSLVAAPGEEPWAVGVRRTASGTDDFSWTNATMLQVGGKVVGCLLGYPLEATPEVLDATAMPPHLAPILELEAEASGSWHIGFLAVVPGWRGQGLGGRLLARAEAEHSGCDGTSLIVTDANTGARRFYARHGYREHSTRPMVKGGWNGRGERWILCRKPPA
jgi:ribosomal protein S18 acetylase RimI-like enzyme